MKKSHLVIIICLVLCALIAYGTPEEKYSEPESRSIVEHEEINAEQEDVTDIHEEQLEVVIPEKTEAEKAEPIGEDLGLMEVHYIDVGEADATLIICGEEAMLVDAGNPDQGTTIRTYLKKHNVGKLKYLLLTHSDRDHIGGAASVVSNVEIDNLFMCQYEKENEVYNNLLNEINYKSMKWSTPEVGSEYTLGDATITIIAPNREYDNPNDSSIAFVIRHGENSFIFTGDAEEPAENDIVNNGLDISADVYYVGHHGSHTSSTQAFLDKVSPEYAIISCAKENEYGHPHVETMDKLKAMGVKLFRTDDQGTIICHSDGGKIVFNVEPSDNWANGEATVNESASTQVKQSVEEQADSFEGNTDITYVLNKNSKKFHNPACDSVREMASKNRKDVDWDRDYIIDKGYRPCKRCNP